MAVKKVIVTGVYGLIAGAVFRHLHERVDAYDVYGLARRRHASERAPKRLAIYQMSAFFSQT
ncbi:MAG: hypothetical protein ACKVJG_22540 [Candidatus Latescibacterota bacterium]